MVFLALVAIPFATAQGAPSELTEAEVLGTVLVETMDRRPAAAEDAARAAGLDDAVADMQALRAWLPGCAAYLQEGRGVPRALVAALGISGKVGAIDGEGFTVKARRGEDRHVKWESLDLGDAAAHRYTNGERSGAEQAMQLTALLYAGELKDFDRQLRRARDLVEGGVEAWADKRDAFGQAVPEGRALLARRRVLIQGNEEALKSLAPFELGGDLAGTTTFARHRTELVSRATEALAAAFDPSTLLNAATCTVEGGSLKLHYPFDKKAELDDWTSCSEAAWRDVRKMAGAGADPDTISDPVVKPDKGKLYATGRLALRHVAEFSGDVSMEIQVKFWNKYDAQAEDPLFFIASVHDDGTGNLYGVDIMGRLLRYAAGTLANFSSDLSPFGIDTNYTFRIERKGDLMLSARDDKETGRQDEPQGRREGGVAFLCVGNFRFVVADIVVRGTLATSWIEQQQRKWAEVEAVRRYGEQVQ